MSGTRDTKSDIAAAAFEVLTERGLPGMTFDRVARRAGCAKGLVNYHFPSRVDLLTTLVALIMGRLWNPRVEALSAPGTGVVEATWTALLDERRTALQLAMSGLASMRGDARVDQAFRLTAESVTRKWVAATGAWLDRSRFRTDSQDEVARATAALLDGFAQRLTTEEPDDLYPAYLTAWLGLIAALSAGRE